ncbi:hypothetical protein I6A84_28800 [Frankia sp. CNm7]|uniref:Uncharacterized protein n=1 Tax=Frankia nepalensis TaxID=1836974 RepID=A0A937RAD9_9ACTN|nr:hypothetical protein [Frankia nepalensis]MBL7499859.1 hypothetical protein [Frankia nepalensis]MBL7515941.1 hypothetical protein [Frankia nepalensis]MBL7521973.1 hypothetical protein [Frankia nepalensis]MBL7628563.1 hypothetical protein [Frankia nepalensis]
MTDQGDGGTSPTSRHDTVMWEVRAAPGRLVELVAWVRNTAVPDLLGRAGCLRVEVFDASDERVVVIARFAGLAPRLPAPPGDLLRRPAHAWPFRHVSTHRPGDV